MKSLQTVHLAAAHPSRSPCGERGLKCHSPECAEAESRRSPCGERGLKSEKVVPNAEARAGRSPCGERGLKLQWRSQILEQLPVAPRAGSVD